MSRSYRKNYVTQQSYSPNVASYYKKTANKKVRRDDDIPKGNGYRKVYEAWKICEYKSKIDINAWWMKDTPWRVISK